MSSRASYAGLPLLGGSLLPRWLRGAAAVLLPVLAVACLLLVAVGNRSSAYDGDATGFVQFGSAFARFTHPPAGALTQSTWGYDGQFYFVVARDPLLLHDATVASLREAPQNTPSQALGSNNQSYRLQRVGYPAAAFALASVLGLGTATALLVLNVALVLGLTGGFALYARRQGLSTGWAIVLGALPGLILATLRDLPDPLATACALGGLLAWTGSRRRVGVLLLVAAVLTREVMLAAVVALAAEAGMRAWRARGTPGATRRIAAEVWPAVVIPFAAFAAWHLYVAMRSGGSTGGAGVSLPLVGFLDHLGGAGGPVSMRLWEVAYLVLTLAAAALAVRAVARRTSVMSLAAVLFAASFLIAPFNDAWGMARDSVPMLAMLLLIGLECRSRPALGVCTAAAAMTVLIPLAIPGSF